MAISADWTKQKVTINKRAQLLLKEWQG